MQYKKKGLSPIIATTLLIVLAIVLFLILWLWIKSFIGEKVTKDVGLGEEAIENFCDKLQFSADVYMAEGVLKASIENTGDIPLYGVEIKKKSFASLKTLGSAIPDTGSIPSGETANDIQVRDDSGSAVTLSPSDSVVILPMLRGMVGEEKKSYTCDKKFGIEKTLK